MEIISKELLGAILGEEVGIAHSMIGRELLFRYTSNKYQYLDYDDYETENIDTLSVNFLFHLNINSPKKS